MKKFRFYWCLFVWLVACRGGATATPTPFPTVGTGTAVSTHEPVSVTLAELAADPERFTGATLQLTGRYQRAPLLICSSDPHPSPAAWRLADGTAVISAGGFDSPLRTLLPDDLTITVEGQWQLWRGPIGCGKQAVPGDVWYLSVSRILSPSLLTQVTLTPSPIGQTEGTPIATAQSFPTAVSTLPSGGEVTPTVFVTTPPPLPPTPETETTPAATISSVAVTAETPTILETATTASETTPVTTEGTAVTPTTAAEGTAVSTPLSTPPGSVLVNKGGFTTEVLATEMIGLNEIHTWNYTVTASSLITIYLASPPGGDMMVGIADPADNLLVEQNEVAGGQIETLAAYELNTAGIYQIQVRAADGLATTYSMSVSDDTSYSLPFMGVLNYGETRLFDLPERTDQFVHFYGTLGEFVTITAEPLDDGDLFIYLHGVDASALIDFFDETGPGEVEQIEGFALPATGLYTIRIGEYAFEPTQYEITITR